MTKDQGASFGPGCEASPSAAQEGVFAESHPIAQEEWLAAVLHDAIQQHVWADAKLEDVRKLIDDLGEGTAFDTHVAALVRIPKYFAASEAQRAVDWAVDNDAEVSAHQAAHQQHNL